jgi:hypothetical protein
MKYFLMLFLLTLLVIVIENSLRIKKGNLYRNKNYATDFVVVNICKDYVSTYTGQLSGL